MEGIKPMCFLGEAAEALGCLITGGGFRTSVTEKQEAF